MRTHIAAAVLASSGLYGIVGAVEMTLFGGPRTIWPAIVRWALTNPLPAGPPTPLHRWLIRAFAFSPSASRAQVALCTQINFSCSARTRAGWAR